MPALPPVPNCIQVRLTYKSSSDLLVMNRFHYKYTGTAPDNTAMGAWATLVSGNWATNMASVTHSSVSLTEVTAVDLSSATGGVGVNAGVHAGTLAGTALPAGTAALVNYTIQRRYRGGKMRTYLPVGSSTDVLDGQLWTTTFRSAVENAWSAFLSASGSAGPGGVGVMNLANVSYYHDFTVKYGSTGRAYNASKLDPTGPHLDPVLTIKVSQNYASQRRRERA